MTVSVQVTVTINEQELEKRNRRAKMVGRAPTTAADTVERLVSDALRHNWVCKEHSLRVVPVKEVRDVHRQPVTPGPGAHLSGTTAE